MRAACSFDQSETQFGVNYYFSKHGFKRQSDITLVKNELAANKDDVIFRLQAQFNC